MGTRIPPPVRFAIFFALPLALSGCSLLPGSGPSRSAMSEAVDPQHLAYNNAEAAFALVELNDSTLGILARRPDPSLRSYFGDYRPTSSQVIGIGDSVQVTLWEAASGGLFSAPVSATGVAPGARTAAIPDQLVGRDGSVTVPYAGRVRVAGRTPQQVEHAIVDRLMGKAIEPQAVVNIAKNVSNTVTVEGDVANGARVPLTLRGDRIMDVIAAAGGYRSPAYETFINLTRGDRTARAPLQALLDRPREDIYVRPGDIINIERAPQTYTVAGATGMNTLVPFGAKSVTLDEAVAKAGGLSDSRADPSGVYLLRYEPTSLVSEFPAVEPNLLSRKYAPVAYHLDMRDPRALLVARRFAIRDKDILYVSNAPLAEIAKVMQLVHMLTQPLMQGAIAARIAN